MRCSHMFALLAASSLAGCFQFEISGHAGYAPLSLSGDIGYQNGSSGAAVKQDIDSGLGLGGTQGAPYARAMLDTGVQVLSVSGFQFSDEGNGTLNATFGDISAGVPVHSKLDMFNLKGAYAFEIGLGPVSISPGIALDYFDMKLDVVAAGNAARQKVDLQAPIPLAFLRGDVDLGIVRATAEAGYLEVDINDLKAKLVDVEAMLTVNPVSLVELFVGYRYINLNVDGRIDSDAFKSDLTLSGLMFGGGVRF